MATYLNPGSARFQKVLDSEIYVDKTGMIDYINSVVNTEQRYVSVSRPRRFGKSITANMLTVYYGKGDSRELFEKRLNRFITSYEDDRMEIYHGFKSKRIQESPRSQPR